MHITNIHPMPRPTSLPAYFLGRPAEMYRRRYRRAVSATPAQS